MIHEFVYFVTIHAVWAGPILGLVALIEALAVVGSFVPGSTILVAVGTAFGALHLSVLPLLPWAVIGAMLGDSSSFAMGRMHGSRILAMRPFHYRPNWTARGRDLLQQRGALAVIAGRLLPPLRALMPLLTGMSELSTTRFLLADFIASILWASLHLLPAAYAGKLVLARWL